MKKSNKEFLKEVEVLRNEKFTFTDGKGKVWNGEMACAKHFGMTRAQYRAKLNEAKVEVYGTNKKTTGDKNARATKPPMQDVTIKARVIPCPDEPNGKYYLELPDGNRLVYTDDGYQGLYNPNITESV